METDQFDVARKAIENALIAAENAAMAEAENALKAFSEAKAEAALLGDGAGGIGVFGYIPEYELLFIDHGGFMPLGSLDDMVASEADIVAEGDVAWGEQLRAAFVKAIEQIDAALSEGRKHPV